MPGWLESIAPMVDCIVALDDGSEDGTGDLLAAHPKVAQLLRNPPGLPWDERGNQVRLVKAARSFGEWAIAIDADERLEIGFAAGVGDLIKRAGEEGTTCFSFDLRSVWGDRNHYRVDGTWAMQRRHRMFRNDPAHRRFDPRPLHRFWMPLEIALQIGTQGRRSGYSLYHLSTVAAEERQGRVMRYEELDAHHLLQPVGYGHLVDETNLMLEPIPNERRYLRF